MTRLAESSAGSQSAEAPAWRDDFPILAHSGQVYLDSAATTQKPRAVIERVSHFYENENANIHRGLYALSQKATDAYEGARRAVAQFINSPEARCVIFTRGTTESINLVANTFGRQNLKPGDEILISAMEHHSNIVPWQMLCQNSGATLRVIPMNDRGQLLMDEYEKMLSGRTRLVSVCHVSNSLGTINPVRQMIELAHQAGAKVLIDGAQWIAHGPTDVQDLDCDFYVFSGHKLYGPTGIGVLYGKSQLLESMPPWQGGGDMIESVRFEGTTYAPIPAKFEAGTPPIAQAAGLAAAIEYVSEIGFDAISAHESRLLRHATAGLEKIPGLRLIGTAPHKASVLSFVVDDPPLSAMDIGVQLDRAGMAIRTGHHCCQPVMERLGVPGTARASLALYNTVEEIDRFTAALERIVLAARSRRPAAGASSEPAPMHWPTAAGENPAEVADDLAETFDLLGDADARGEFVMDLANDLPHTFDLLKDLTPQVPGCMSQVHILGRGADGGRLEFLADANAEIVRGLIAILTKLYSGQKAEDIMAFDVETFFRRIGLERFITSQRRNGLEGMVRRIKALAQRLSQTGQLTAQEQR